MTLVDRMKNIFSSSPTEPANAAARGVQLSILEPAPDSDTCKIELDQEIAPDQMILFESYTEAEGWPLVQALMRVPGIQSVIVKGKALIISKASAVDWTEILEPAENAIRASLDPSAREELSPVDAIAAATTVTGDESEALRQRVQEVIDSQINPSVAGHGGYISLLDVQGTRVFLHMGGGCQGCEMSAITLKHGVETTLREQVPEITEILDTTDHAAGTNPFFQRSGA